MMLTLCISTSTDAVSVAVGDNGEVTASFTQRGGRRHAEALLPTIEQVLSGSARDVEDIGMIAVDIGPGLFTGMRVGIATASAMAQALDVNVVELCSLDVLARSVMGLAEREDVAVWSVLDARRGEVFYACHRIGDRAGIPVMERVVAPTVGTPEELAAAVDARGQRCVCIGSGAQNYAEVLRNIACNVRMDDLPDLPEASVMVPMAHAAATREEYVRYGAITPMYLRAPDAEINWVTR